MVEVQDSILLQVPRRLRFAELGVAAVRQHCLGCWEGLPCYAVEVADPKPPPGMAFRGLRQVCGLLGEELFVLSGRALQGVGSDPPVLWWQV